MKLSAQLNDCMMRIIGIPLISASGLLALMPFYFQERWDLFGYYFIASIIFTFVTWEECRYILIRVRERIPGLENTGKRLAVSVLLFLIVAGFNNMLVKLALGYFDLKPPALEGKSFFDWWLSNMPANVFFVVLLSCIYEAIYYIHQYRAAVEKTRDLKKIQAKQQLETLKSRVNPHFLFNSLTTLSTLISEDSDRAEHFVNELAKVYRYLLRAGKQSTATLAEELQFAESYAFLLKNRFSAESFVFDCAAPKGNCDREIPVLSVQNAIDYLVRTQNLPLRAAVLFSQNHLTISCEDHPKDLIVDVTNSDWKQLELAGASRKLRAGKMSIEIPFVENYSLS